ncbi:MAG: sulfurtransferase-like selenium metabolism protein YedF, partial [Clostridiales bacterium]
LQKQAMTKAETVAIAPVIVISSQQFGRGSEELAANLMKSYIYALTEVSPQPETVIFINSGIFLTCQDSPVLDSLLLLAAQGVQIYSCGACLNFYDRTAQLAVGNIGNMYQFVEKMNQAANCIEIQ